MAVVLKADFLDVDFDKDEENEKTLRDDGDFKWIDISCYTRAIPAFNVRMSPLCQL